MVAAVLGGFRELSGDYRIVLEGPPPYDLLPIRAELAEGIRKSDGLQIRIESTIKKQLGASAKVELVPTGSLPLTEGKTKRVIRRDS
jgi:phenylacetate-CoA ligase